MLGFLLGNRGSRKKKKLGIWVTRGAKSMMRKAGRGFSRVLDLRKPNRKKANADSGGLLI